MIISLYLVMAQFLTLAQKDAPIHLFNSFYLDSDFRQKKAEVETSAFLIR